MPACNKCLEVKKTDNNCLRKECIENANNNEGAPLVQVEEMFMEEFLKKLLMDIDLSGLISVKEVIRFLACMYLLKVFLTVVISISCISPVSTILGGGDLNSRVVGILYLIENPGTNCSRKCSFSVLVPFSSSV